MLTLIKIGVVWIALAWITALFLGRLIKEGQCE